MKISSFTNSKKKSISSVIFLFFILFASSIFITIDRTQASPISNIHNYITGNLTELECQKCHISQEIQVKQVIDVPNKLIPKGTTGIVNIRLSAQAGDNYTAVLAVGQTPYQLGPFYRNGFTGWSWWDTESYGTEKQKNLISLMVMDETGGTTKPLTGLASRPVWPQALYRNQSRNYSYKADTAPSPITTQINYPDQADILMIKEVDLTGYSNANLTFWTWYEIENDYDYGYVAISYDGYTWNNLPGTLTTADNPYGNNLGNGITGNTNGNWVQETMNLTQYTGNKILLGFKFRSDINYNLEGWYVDDINVTSDGLTILSDNAETPGEIRSLRVNVTYPHLTLINITDPLSEAATLQYSQGTQQVNLQEDINHPGTYAGYFYYDPFAEQYSGNYSVTFDATINGSSVTASSQFQTTVFGCQSCHNKKDSGIETSIIHNESGYYGGSKSCMFNCHSGSRGLSGGSPHFNIFPLNANPMHVHEMKYGHTGGFLPNINYEQPSYNIQSHAGTTTCTQCHTSFLHDNIGSDTEKIANYTLYGTNINFSSGTHKNLTCEYCHGTLDYPIIPENQYQLQGSIGHYSPGFTSHESFTDTYIIAVNRTDNLTITVNGDPTTKLLELYTIGPVDNTSTALQGPCDGYPCDMIQSLETPIFMNITNPFMGTWIVKLIQFEGGVINYTISSNYPIQEKPIIRIPECNSCHNSSAIGKTFTNDRISDWNPGNAHVDIDKDGTYDVQCRMCHNAMHDIMIKDCQACHTMAPTNHPLIDPAFSQYTQFQCLGCHGSPHNVSAGGGADCVSCHDIEGGGAPLDKRINVSSIKQGVHKNLNNGTYNTTLLTDPVDKACWACHGDGMEPSNGHPDNFRIPYSCEDCHGQTGNLSYTNTSLISNLTTRKVFNHVPSPAISQYASSIKNNASADCKGCHDKSKVIYSDSGLSIEANVSHYASRTNLVSPTIDCNLCHKNPLNASIYWANVTRHPAKTQDIAFCENCHFTDMLSADFHSSGSLKIKRVHIDFRWAENLCSTPCHGGPSRKICEDCHLPDGSGPYMVDTWKDLRNMTPRVFAHTNFSTIINVPNQSNVIAPSQGAETFSSCYAFNISTLSGTCHAVPIQNKNAGGGYFTLNNYIPAYDNGSAYHEAITIDRMPDTTNCLFCHNQTNATIIFIWGNGTQINAGTHNWYTGNDNSRCWSCHVSTGKAPEDFHSESMSPAGGEGCLDCHTVDRGIYPAINITSFSKHKNVNRTDEDYNLTNEDCLICHYDFNFTVMLENGFSTPTRTCTECHIYGNFSAPVITNHRSPNQSVSPGGRISTNAYCTICHNNSIRDFNYSANASVSHYGTNTSLIKPTINQTALPGFGFMNSSDASAYNKECNNCHKPSNKDYGNATLISVSHTSSGTCNRCHVNGSAYNLHNSTLGMPETFGCKACHTSYADKYGAPNLIGTTMEGRSITSCEGCHGGGGNNGLLDSLSKHNIDRNENGFTGMPGRTGIVYLNNQITLTVTKGTVVTITSSVNDTAGQASRVGGAEYYIDVDPGIGKGTPMDAVDGYYNAVNTNWENVTGTIDTSLSDGTHTVYVRGVDIGKQWSQTKNAALTVQSLGYINGTVTNGSMPVLGVIVSVNGASCITDQDGKYSLFIIEGTYTVNASNKPEYYDNSTTGVVVTSNNTTIQDFILSLKPTGNIIGTVKSVKR